MYGNFYQNNGVNWVQGEAGAKAWLMAANSTVLLMDSEAPRFFIKQTDQYGMPLPIRVFNYTEVTQGAQIGTIPSAKDESVEHITKAEFDALTKRVDALEGEKK
jgi:hypothetical protein